MTVELKVFRDDTNCIEFVSENEVRHFTQKSYYEKMLEFCQELFWTNGKVGDWDNQTMRETLIDCCKLDEFENEFVNKTYGLFYASGKSKLINITGMNIRQIGTYKNGKNFDYSTATFHFGNGLVGRNFKNYTYDKACNVGEVYEFLYTETLGKYNPIKCEFARYRNIGIIGNKKFDKKPKAAKEKVLVC